MFELLLVYMTKCIAAMWLADELLVFSKLAIQSMYFCDMPLCPH